jgi:hypothetical protein
METLTAGLIDGDPEGFEKVLSTKERDGFLRELGGETELWTPCL